MHLLSSLQAVAHGAEFGSVFSVAQKPGSAEKQPWRGCGSCRQRAYPRFPGCHAGWQRLKTRQRRPRAGTAQAAVIFDWDNRWGFRRRRPRKDKQADETVFEHYLRCANAA
jgi:beta-galactosidase GanA